MTEYHELADEMSLEECIKSFVNMRKKIKKPMTENALRLLNIKLRKIGDEREQKAALLRAEERSWLTVYPFDNAETSEPDLFGGL